jgi:hypothetical protein
VVSKLALKRRIPRTSRKEFMSSQITIDEAEGLVFESEEELYDYFLPQTQKLEKQFFMSRKETDIPEKDFKNYEDLLNHVLNDPDEVWEDSTKFKNCPIYCYVGHYIVDQENVYYVAIAYRTGEVPSFIFLHYPSNDLELVDTFRKGKLIYDRVLKEVEQGAVDGDALSEGDDLAVGLYKAMLKVRAPNDIAEEKFKSYENLRENTIEEADEIWRSTDLTGNVLVSFIKEFGEEPEKDLHYVVVTIEDPASSSHALLFSFPTDDENLLDRYRHGENLHAEEIVQEASH